MMLPCPNVQCGKENPVEALRCTACGTSLRAYFWLRLLPDYLFNQGLDFAQKGQFQQAEQALQGALLFAGQDVEAQMLLATVQALQSHAPAASATLGRLGGRTPANPRLAGLHAALQAELTVAEPPVPEPPVQPASLPDRPAHPGRGHRQRKQKP